MSKKLNKKCIKKNLVNQLSIILQNWVVIWPFFRSENSSFLKLFMAKFSPFTFWDLVTLL